MSEDSQPLDMINVTNPCEVDAKLDFWIEAGKPARRYIVKSGKTIQVPIAFASAIWQVVKGADGDPTIHGGACPWLTTDSIELPRVHPDLAPFFPRRLPDAK